MSERVTIPIDPKPPAPRRRPAVAAPGSASADPAVPVTPAATPGSAPPDETSDVFVRNRALVFAPTQKPLPEPVRRERARRFLQALRAGSGDAIFGIPLTGGVDTTTSLRGLYATVDAMARLAPAFPGAHSVLRRFRDSIAPDLLELRPVLHAAVGDVGSVAEPARPLGGHSGTGDADAELQHVLERHDPDSWLFGASDDVVDHLGESTTALFEQLSKNPKWLKHPKHAPFILPALRFLARARERGNTQIQSFSNWPAITAQLGPDAGPVLARFAEAVGEPLGNIVLATGQRLSELFPPESSGGQSPLGGETFTDFATWKALIDGGQTRATEASDASLRLLMKGRDPSGLVEPLLLSGNPAVQVRGVLLLARLAELGFPSRGTLDDLEQIAHGPAADAAVWRLLQARNPREAEHDFAHWRERGRDRRMVRDRNRAGTISMTPTELGRAVNAANPELFTIDDASLRKLFARVPSRGHVDALAELASRDSTPEWHGGVLRLVARAGEAGLVTPERQQDYLLKELPRALLSSPPVLRALADLLLDTPSLRTAKVRTELLADPGVAHALWTRGQVRAGPFAPTDPNIDVPWPPPYDPKQLGAAATAKQLAGAATTLDDLSFARGLLVQSNRRATVLAAEGAEAVLVDLAARIGTGIPDNPAGIQEALASVRAFLEEPLQPEYVKSDAGLALTCRLAQLAKAPLSELTLEKGDTVEPFLDVVPQSRLFGAAPDADVLRERLLGELDPAKGASPSARLAAVRSLLSTSPALGTFSELLDQLVSARLSGHLAPVDATGLPAEQRAALADALVSGRAHLLTGPVLGGLALKLEREDWDGALERLGFSPSDANTFGEVAADLAELSGEALRFATARLDQGALAAEGLHFRVRVAQGSLEWLESYRQPAHEYVDLMTAIRAVLERAAREPEDSPDRARAIAWVNALVASGQVDRGLVTQAVTPEILARASPDEGAVLRAVEGVLQAPSDSRSAALDGLVKAIQSGSAFAPEGERVERALNALWRGDLDRVEPLDQADRALGGVPGQATDAAPALPPGVTVKNIAGVLLRVYPLEPELAHLVPRAEDFVYVDLPGPERQEIYQAMASCAATQTPFGQVGAPGVAKTTLATRIAYETNSPFIDMQVTAGTEAAHFVGMYMQAERRYSDAELDAMSDFEIRRAAVDYTLDFLELSVDALRAELKLRQVKPWFKLGPIPWAMIIGAKVNVDESQLADPAERDAFQNALKEKGFLTIPGYPGVIRPHPRFAIFFANNDADTEGRRPPDAAERSRIRTKYVPKYTEPELTRIVDTLYGKVIPPLQRAQLVAVHHRLAEKAAGGRLGAELGGLEFTPRNLQAVANRFQRFAGGFGGLTPEALLAREMGEVYLLGLPNERDRQEVLDVLTAGLDYREAELYADLALNRDDPDFLTLGDVVQSRLHSTHPLVPGEDADLILSPRLLKVLYLETKAQVMGEAACFVGPRGVGKSDITQFKAYLRRQPFHFQQFSGGTDNTHIIGGYGAKGWVWEKLPLALDENDPGAYCGDEFNRASTEVTERLNSVTDHRRRLTVMEHRNEVMRVPRDTAISFTLNPVTAEYTDRNYLSAPALNRLRLIYVPDYERGEVQNIGIGMAKKAGILPEFGAAYADLMEWMQTQTQKKRLQTRVPSDRRMELTPRILKSAVLQTREKVALGTPMDRAYLQVIASCFKGSRDEADNKAIEKQARRLARLA